MRFGIAILVPLSFIISQCFHKDQSTESTPQTDPRGATYAGSASCLKCHKNIYQDYLHNEHYLTSRSASEATMHGSFSPDSNTDVYNDSVKVMMLKHNDSLYQASYINGTLTNLQAFDITFGNKRGETFLYWRGQYVYQLPVTYYIGLHKWANSPGYNANFVNYDRIIGEACFECHSSYIRQIPPSHEDIVNKTIGLEKASMLLGIDCERCHGPAAHHVSFHIHNPKEKQAMYITRISSLSRARRIDLCSVCHSGVNQIIYSTFEFKPGDKLDNFKDRHYIQKTTDPTRIDVHGNQVGLLTGSQCFIKGQIECGTCHNMHDNRVKSVKMYSQVCTGCHSVDKHNFCKIAGKLGQGINSNCLDCHMPLKSSSAIVIHDATQQTKFPFIGRTHRIAIYPEETKKVMAWFKNPAKPITD